METNKHCACSGVRYCLMCKPERLMHGGSLSNELESSSSIDKGKCKEVITERWNWNQATNTETNCYIFCLLCRRIHSANSSCFVGDNNMKNNSGQQHHDKYSCQLNINGISVLENFVSEEEERDLISKINNFPWKLSQSGRRKQDFGPKANFKRKKLKIGNFNGLPSCTRFLVNRIQSTDILCGFEPVEVCHLEYNETRGSSIDPHIDDEWLWGERLVTLSLASSSFLCLTHDEYPNKTVKIPMPARSLIILQDEARHQWKHSILPGDINQIRIAVTFRELTAEFLRGGQNESIGNDVRAIANSYLGTPQYTGVSEE